MTDKQLIYNIQNEHSVDESLNLLIQRHSGIYINIVNSYVPKNSPFVRKSDIIEEKDYHIYMAALKYEEGHGTKFSTYLGNETKWLCLNTFNKAKRRPELTSEDFIQEKNIYEDADLGEERELLGRVFEFTRCHPDPRVAKIFNLRYVETHGNKLTPWEKISAKLNLSIQGCINIHNKALETIKLKLISENA